MTFVKMIRQSDSDNEHPLSIGSLLCLLYLYLYFYLYSLYSALLMSFLCCMTSNMRKNPINRRFDKHRLEKKYFWSNLVHYPGVNYFLFTTIGFSWMTEAKSDGNQSFSFERSNQKKSSFSSNTSAGWLGTWSDTTNMSFVHAFASALRK